MLLDAGGYRGRTHYAGAHHAKILFGGRLPEPSAPTAVIAFHPDRHRHDAPCSGLPPPRRYTGPAGRGA